MKFFSRDIVEVLSSLSVNMDVKAVSFVSDNPYSAFQLARIYKIPAIHFAHKFYKEAMGYAKKTGIRCSFDSSVVTDENKAIFADFAKKNYNPVEKQENALVVSSSRGAPNCVVDIANYVAGDEHVFYSNMQDNNVQISTAKIVGFSYDKSIFSGSKRIHKQIRISGIPQKTKEPLPKYSNEDIAKVMSSRGSLNFAHLKFLFSMLDEVVKMPMFASIMSGMPTAMSFVKKGVFAIDSMTRKEVMNPKIFTNSDSRVKRISKGSKVDEAAVAQMISFAVMLNQYGMQEMTEELRKRASSDPQMSKMLGQLGPLMKVFGK